MSVFRYKGSRVWTMDFMFQGQRIRETTGTRSKTLATEIERKRRQQLEEGSAGIRRKKQPKLFSFTAKDWLDLKRTSLAPRSIVIEEFNLGHLMPVFGKKLIVDIEPREIVKYQKARLAEGASPRTVNIEVGTLRAILREHGLWARLQKQIAMLPLGQEIGRAISPDEERKLLGACGKSRSRSLLPLVILALETGARFNTLRTLQWRNVDFSERTLRFGKDKTQAGSGRVIPLNQRALATLQFWSTSFPDRQPAHYVFPSELYGLVGEEGYLNGRSGPYQIDVTKAMLSWKTSWNSARKAADVQCRFHDLRHTAVSRMINAGVPITKVAKLVGWTPSTMVAMAARYGHHGLEDLKECSRDGQPFRITGNSFRVPGIFTGTGERRSGQNPVSHLESWWTRVESNHQPVD